MTKPTWRKTRQSKGKERSRKASTLSYSSRPRRPGDEEKQGQMSATPPPPYPGDPSGRFQIKRKPVLTSPAALASPVQPERSTCPSPSGREHVRNRNTALESLETSIPGNITDSPLYASPAQSRVSTGLGSTSTASSLPARSTASCPPPGETSSTTLSYAQKAYREARHFAGGLIRHPTESTKHFTILRHSHGIVFYQGSSTSLAVSIFADAPLPPDRTLWLQNKGWTGKTGMRAKAFLGFNGNWLNVTPTVPVRSEQLNPSDERAWQRDINKFRKQGPRHVRERHQLRETAVVRVPVEAGDGYFQLVLCQGDKKKTLCNSPVFRVMSTSLDPSSIRGASLSTLPLELGAMVLGMTAQSALSTVVEPVTATMQNTVDRALPSFWAQTAASTLYDLSGVEDKVAAVIKGEEEDEDEGAGGRLPAMAGSRVADLERGPVPPYPIYFVARCESLAANQVHYSSLPTMGLTGLSDLVVQRLYGHYFGWIRILEKGDKEKGTGGEPWHQVLITALQVNVGQLTRVNVAQVIKKRFTLRLIESHEEISILGKKLEVQVMGFIRPDGPSQVSAMEKRIEAGDEAAFEAAMLVEATDISIAQGALDHPSWSPDVLFRGSSQEERLGWLERAKNGCITGKTTVEKHIDRVPLRRLGVRMGTDQLKDKMIVTNGFYIAR